MIILKKYFEKEEEFKEINKYLEYSCVCLAEKEIQFGKSGRHTVWKDILDLSLNEYPKKEKEKLSKGKGQDEVREWRNHFYHVCQEHVPRCCPLQPQIQKNKKKLTYNRSNTVLLSQWIIQRHKEKLFNA